MEAVRKESTDEDTLSLAGDIAAEISEQLNARNDVLLALVITEDGVAASKVVSSPTKSLLSASWQLRMGWSPAVVWPRQMAPRWLTPSPCRRMTSLTKNNK